MAKPWRNLTTPRAKRHFAACAFASSMEHGLKGTVAKRGSNFWFSSLTVRKAPPLRLVIVLKTFMNLIFLVDTDPAMINAPSQRSQKSLGSYQIDATSSIGATSRWCRPSSFAGTVSGHVIPAMFNRMVFNRMLVITQWQRVSQTGRHRRKWASGSVIDLWRPTDSSHHQDLPFLIGNPERKRYLPLIPGRGITQNYTHYNLLGCPQKLGSWFITYLWDLQPTYIRVGIYLLSTIDISV